MPRKVTAPVLMVFDEPDRLFTVGREDGRHACQVALHPDESDRVAAVTGGLAGACYGADFIAAACAPSAAHAV